MIAGTATDLGTCDRASAVAETHSATVFFFGDRAAKQYRWRQREGPTRSRLDALGRLGRVPPDHHRLEDQHRARRDRRHRHPPQQAPVRDAENHDELHHGGNAGEQRSGQCRRAVGGLAPLVRHRACRRGPEE